MRDLNEIVIRAETAAETETVGEADGYPILRATLGPADALTILVLAGTHGDEPASVEAALTFLERRDRPTDMRFEVVPCVNPHGYVHNTRLNRDSIDLNWSWHRPELPEIQALQRATAGKRYIAAIDFHEDWESPGFYVYEMVRDRPSLGKEIARRVSEVCPVNTASEIEGDTSEQGVIRPDPHATRRQKRGYGIPIALFDNHTDHYFTSESPTGEPMPVRVAAHLTALDTVIERYS